MNCLQGFTLESSRDKHYAYCIDNETVRVEMPREGSTVEFCDGQNQFKVPFIMYADFETILEPMGPQGPGYPIESLILILINLTANVLTNTFPLVGAFTTSLHMARLRVH